MNPGNEHNLTVDELLALLRDASLSAASIAEEIECAGATPCAVPGIERARELLGNFASTTFQVEPKSHAAGLVALPEMLAGALLRVVAEAGHQEILREVAQGPHRALAKEAKRELQRLKQKGVQVQALAPQGESVLKAAPKEDAPACYASSIDAYGERAVWYAKSGRTGVDLAQVVLSDVKGIISADALPLSRKSYREFVKRLPRGNVVTCAEVTPAHARFLIAEAEAHGSRNGFSPPQSYQRALALLGAVNEAPADPIAELELTTEEELAHQMAGGALFSDPLFAAWVPEEEPLRAYAARAEELAKSELFADESQRVQALTDHAKSAAETYFNDARKSRYARRLREMAFLLRADTRLDAARSALATARALEGKGGVAHPFCETLFTHALDALGRANATADARAGRAAKPPAQEGSGLITSLGGQP